MVQVQDVFSCKLTPLTTYSGLALWLLRHLSSSSYHRPVQEMMLEHITRLLLCLIIRQKSVQLMCSSVIKLFDLSEALDGPLPFLPAGWKLVLWAWSFSSLRDALLNALE